MYFPSLLARGLSRVLKATRARGANPLPEEHRFVIVSDHHKGAGTDADTDVGTDVGTDARPAACALPCPSSERASRQRTSSISGAR